MITARQAELLRRHMTPQFAERFRECDRAASVGYMFKIVIAHIKLYLATPAGRAALAEFDAAKQEK